MQKRNFRACSGLSLCLGLLAVNLWRTTISQAAPHSIQAPILQWQQGGCYTAWCETGWYSSPAVADLNGDGQPEVIASAYPIVALDGATGHLLWRVRSGHDRSENPDVVKDVGRTWPGIVIADVDDDGQPEIVTAHGGGFVAVYDRNGYFKPGWPQHPVTGELRGLSVVDLDNDGKLEIVVTAAMSSKTNTWVFEPNGTVRPGWPQLTTNNGYAAGIYNANAGIADLDGDGMGEIVVPSDVHYIAAYNANGVPLQANARYGNKVWGLVGVHVADQVDLRGYANCGTEHRPNFANSPATIADVNGDGMLEVVVVGNIYNCGTNPYTDLYEMPFIFNKDRSRWSGSGFDWTVIPTPDSKAAPLSEDYNLIENNLPNPVIADLDGDGQQEILYASYDGRVHAYWLDKTEHGHWPFAVNNAGEGFYRFATEPVVADLDNDGHAEVIFAAWPQKGTNQTGRLYILEDQGNMLQAINLPVAFGGGNWNGALAAPTLANIDGDADLEVVLNTSNAGFVAYDLPGTANAHILWGTGRGSYQRNGAVGQSAQAPTPTPSITTVPAPPTLVSTAPTATPKAHAFLPVITQKK